MNSTPEAPTRIVLSLQPGIPDGLQAVAVPTGAATQFPTDRRGRPKVSRVIVEPIEPVAPSRPDGFSDTEWTWLTASPRRWETLVKKLGDHHQALETVTVLTLHGCGVTVHSYDRGDVTYPPLRWEPVNTLRNVVATSQRARMSKNDELRTQAAQLSELLAPDWPQVAASLLRDMAESRRVWLVHAAADLLAEVVHDGVRAFVQAHNPTDDKARDDLPKLLRGEGWEAAAIRRLGIDRNPYIGLGGPIQVHHDGRVLDLTGWPGPKDVRLPADVGIRLTCAPDTEILLIIENRQAAETICDEHPDMALVWCHGQPPDIVATLISQLAGQVGRTIICTDADLGGVRIAARIYDRISQGKDCDVLDIGIAPHRPGKPFSPDTLTLLRGHAHRSDVIGSLAEACLSRGYAITQEALVRETLRQALG